MHAIRARSSEGLVAHICGDDDSFTSGQVVHMVDPGFVSCIGVAVIEVIVRETRFASGKIVTIIIIAIKIV